MNKKNIYMIATVILIVLTGWLFFGNKGPTSDAAGVVESGEYQKIVLGMKNYNYYPQTVTVKAGIPVRIYLDSSVVGCYRSFTVRAFGVGKFLRTPNDYVEFTPTKPGTYGFSCSMGMGTGTLIVE